MKGGGDLRHGTCRRPISGAGSQQSGSKPWKGSFLSVESRLLTAAATGFSALSAGAAPALASGRGPAAQEALKLQPTIRLNIDPSGNCGAEALEDLAVEGQREEQ